MKNKLIFAAVVIVTFVIFLAVNSIDYSPLVLPASMVLGAIDIFVAIQCFSK